MSGPGAELAAAARLLHRLGWMPGTAGNLSVRTTAGALVTASGLAKGELGDGDSVAVGIADSEPLTAGPTRPSAETQIHTAIYRATGCSAVVHAHPPYATAVSIRPGPLRFERFELIKGLGGPRTDLVEIALFPNWPDVGRIGREVEEHLATRGGGPAALVLIGHGATTWGDDLGQARDRMECLESLCQLSLLAGTRSAPPLPTHHTDHRRTEVSS